MRFRTIHVKLWGDARFKKLTPLQPSGQGLFLYLLTNPGTNSIPGLYRAGAAAMAEELCWELKDFKKAFQEVLQLGFVKADLKARVIFIPNAIKYNKPQSPNVVISWQLHWDEIPECELKVFAHHHLKAFLEGLGEAYLKAFGKAIAKPLLNQEQEQEQEQNKNECKVSNETSPLSSSENLDFTNTQSKDYDSNLVKEIFEHWQKVMAHPRAKLDEERKRKIKTALKNYSLEDVKKAVDGCQRTPFNMGYSEDGQKYDGICTILRDNEQIERFIRNAEHPPKPSKLAKPDDTYDELTKGAL